MRIGMKVSPLTVLRAGIPNYIMNLLASLAETEDENEYFLYTCRPLSGSLELPERFRTVPVRFPSCRLQLWYQLGLPLRMRKDRLDLFHDPVYPLPFLLPVPGVITVHDLSNYETPDVHGARAALAARLYPSHLRRASMIIADSMYTASRIAELFPWAADKVEVVPLGVSDSFRRVERGAETSRVAEKYGLPPRFMLFLGTLEPRKNLDRLLSAFQSVAGDIPHWLVIAGGLGWKYRKLLEKISRHPMKKRIILTGFVEDADLPALLSSAEFLVYPSLLEGFGLPVLEAMACGTPVLTSDTSSMPEVAGEAALLVDPLSIESIENGIRLLATDISRRESLSEKGMRRASGYSWKNTAAGTLEVYKRVLEKHRVQLP